MHNKNPEQVKKILSWYPAMTEAQRVNFLRIIDYGRIGGTGKFVILPVDQGFEHGPGRSFESNPVMYDPLNHARLAIDAGCNAYAAPIGCLEKAKDVVDKAGIPTILKVNNHDMLMPDGGDPFPAITSWVEDAVRLRCAAVGFTLYPGSAHSREIYEQARALAKDARASGLVVVLWSYARGSGLLPFDEQLKPKDIETAVDVVCYAVHIAALLGAHIIKAKPPKAIVGLKDSVKNGAYKNVPIGTLSDRIQLMVQSAFNGERVVINSGGEAKGKEEVLAEVRELAHGGSFGSIVGRNSFQRPHNEAVELLHNIQDIYAG